MKRNLHFRPYFRRALPLVFISLLALVSRAAGITALEEDFESMSDGPIDTQNGWSAHPTALQMVVDSTNQLGTRVLDGLDAPARPPWEFTFATKPLALGRGFSRLTASHDAFAVQDSGGLPSHSSGLRVVATSIPANPGFGSNGPGWKYDRTNRGWQFDGRFGAANSNIIVIPGGFDREVHFETIIDRRHLETWGRWDFGDEGSGETPRYPLTEAQIDTIDAVQFDQDFRFAASRGVEIDNILVTYTPRCGLLLEEDFESMDDGPLDGQNGWSAFPTTLQMVVDSTNNLGTRVLDGLDVPSPRPPYEFTYATKPLGDVGMFGALVARFDAYAVQNSGGVPSHSSPIGLVSSSLPANPGFGFQGSTWTYDRVNQRWQFDGRYGVNPSSVAEVPGGFDKKVTLEIVIDRTRRETWGTWDFGGGEVGETAKFPVSLEHIDAIDLFKVSQDFRFSATRGFEIDNITVTCTPPVPHAGKLLMHFDAASGAYTDAAGNSGATVGNNVKRWADLAPRNGDNVALDDNPNTVFGGLFHGGGTYEPPSLQAVGISDGLNGSFRALRFDGATTGMVAQMVGGAAATINDKETTLFAIYRPMSLPGVIGGARYGTPDAGWNGGYGMEWQMSTGPDPIHRSSVRPQSGPSTWCEATHPHGEFVISNFVSTGYAGGTWLSELATGDGLSVTIATGIEQSGTPRDSRTLNPRGNIFTSLVIGRGDTSNGSYLSADLCELLVFDGALSAVERSEVRDYFLGKYFAVPFPSPRVRFSGNELIMSWPSFPRWGYQMEIADPGLTGWSPIPGTAQQGTGGTMNYNHDAGVPPAPVGILRLRVDPSGAGNP